MVAGEPRGEGVPPTIAGLNRSAASAKRDRSGSENSDARKSSMIEFNPAIAVMNDEDLIACTRDLARKSCGVEAQLLHHLGEIDARALPSQRAYPSMIAFCMKELGFSEGAAYYRIQVARAARRIPAILQALASGQVHLAGLRVLAPHLDEENHERVLAEAAGKSKREIEELVARLSPEPPVPDAIRKLPQRVPALPLTGTDASAPTPATPLDRHLSRPATPFDRHDSRQPIVAPLSADKFKIQFTGSRELRDKLRQAQDLLRHRVPGGDLAGVFERALDALIANLLKERFALGRTPRGRQSTVAVFSASRHVPAHIKRAVWERDGGRCAFIAEDGRRCFETGGLEFDHIDGWARTHVHDVDRIRLTCRAHNQHAAEQLYGRELMNRIRESRKEACSARPCPAPEPLAQALENSTRPGASSQQRLF